MTQRDFNRKAEEMKDYLAQNLPDQQKQRDFIYNLVEMLEYVERLAGSAATTASCLANGIRPD